MKINKVITYCLTTHLRFRLMGRRAACVRVFAFIIYSAAQVLYDSDNDFTIYICISGRFSEGERSRGEGNYYAIVYRSLFIMLLRVLASVILPCMCV